MQKEQYIFAVARTRVLETKLLSDAFIERLITASDASRCRMLLAEKGWEDDIDKEEAKILQTVIDLRVPRDEFEMITLPNLYHNLKAAIKEMVSDTDNPQAFFPDPDYPRERMLKILETKDYRALPEHMRDAAKEAYENFLATQDGQLCDIMIDRACLEAIRLAGEKSNEQVIRDYAKTTVEVSNIKIAYRCSKTGKHADFILKALATCRGMNLKEMSMAAAIGTEKFCEYLRGTSFSAAAAALEESASAFDRWCDNTLIEAIKPQKMNPFGIGPVFAYAIARQNEVKTVRLILLGKEIGLSQDAIRERVRKMYG